MTERQPARWPVGLLLAVTQPLQLLSMFPWFLAMLFGLTVHKLFERPDMLALYLAIAIYPLWLLAGDIASWVLLYLRQRVLACVITGIVTLPTVLILAYGLADSLLHPLP